MIRNVQFQRVNLRNKETLRSFDVVLFDICITKFEADSPVSVFIAVVRKVLAGLYVVLIAVGPVQTSAPFCNSSDTALSKFFSMNCSMTARV